jgi:glucose/arabinose dehydrogenase
MRAIKPAAIAAATLVTAAAVMHAQQRAEPRVVSSRVYANAPALAEWDASVIERLRVPAGFRVSVFAKDLGTARMLAVSDDGTVYVTRRDSGDVLALRDDGTGKAATPRKVVTDLPRVHGIALHGGRLYLATIREVFVADVSADGSAGTPRAIVTGLPDGGQHPNRTVGVGPDGMLYVSVGSTCNQCMETNDEHATILQMALDGSRRGVFARGLRNTVGFTWNPETRTMWGVDHGIDYKGNEIPPEELNEIQNGLHYGWPFCYGTRVADAAYALDPPGSTKAEFCPRTVAPTLTFDAHMAPMQIAFYQGTSFPAEYRGDAFVAMRGSWNRSPAVGYKVVRIEFRDGVPTRSSDFLTGFLSQDGERHYGRIAGIAVARDGSLLVADDANGVIYRVSHGASNPSAR